MHFGQLVHQHIFANSECGERHVLWAAGVHVARSRSGLVAYLHQHDLGAVQLISRPVQLGLQGSAAMLVARSEEHCHCRVVEGGGGGGRFHGGQGGRAQARRQAPRGLRWMRIYSATRLASGFTVHVPCSQAAPARPPSPRNGRRLAPPARRCLRDTRVVMMGCLEEPDRIWPRPISRAVGAAQNLQIICSPSLWLRLPSPPRMASVAIRASR